MSFTAKFMGEKIVQNCMDFRTVDAVAMATHSSDLAWKIPGTAEPGGLPSMGSHRVGHN